MLMAAFNWMVLPAQLAFIFGCFFRTRAVSATSKSVMRDFVPAVFLSELEKRRGFEVASQKKMGDLSPALRRPLGHETGDAAEGRTCRSRSRGQGLRRQP